MLPNMNTSSDLVISHSRRQGHALAYRATDPDTGHVEDRVLVGVLDLTIGEAAELVGDLAAVIVAELREEGMSTRAIGTALGVSNQTVANDLAGVKNLTPRPKPVTGLDGKTYTPKAPVIHLADQGEVPDDEVRGPTRRRWRRRADAGCRAGHTTRQPPEPATDTTGGNTRTVAAAPSNSASRTGSSRPPSVSGLVARLGPREPAHPNAAAGPATAAVPGPVSSQPASPGARVGRPHLPVRQRPGTTTANHPEPGPPAPADPGPEHRGRDSGTTPSSRCGSGG